MKTNYYCDNKQDFPTEQHYAILSFSSVFVPGDERSRMAPGHGYPEHYENTVVYRVYFDKVEWETEIRRRIQAGDTQFSATLVTPANIEHRIEVDVKI